MNYKVGQVLYLCNEESMKIIPLQIIEEVVRTTINGTEKNYILLFPDNKKTKIDLNKIKGKVFESIEQIQSHMIQNATEAINRMAKTAEILKEKAFDVVEDKKNVPQKEIGVQVEANDDIIMVDLGNGTKAKMNTSSLEKVINQ